MLNKVQNIIETATYDILLHIKGYIVCFNFYVRVRERERALPLVYLLVHSPQQVGLSRADAISLNSAQSPILVVVT